MRYDWVNRAAEHDSDLASRRRERMAKELEREKDYAVTLSRAALAKVAERIDSMDFKGLEARQVPVALKRLFELEFKALGMEDKVALSHEGKVEVEAERIPPGSWTTCGRCLSGTGRHRRPRVAPKGQLWRTT